MPTRVLNAAVSPPDGVASPSSITVFVGNPPRELRIYSGVALPEWESKEDLDYEDVIVVLGPPTTQFFQFTSTVGLASITNTDSDFIFAADESSVVNTPGGLELHVRIGVMGDDSTFSRFSYHVQVLSDPITARISGNIRWQQSLGDPTEAAKHGAVPLFRVAAGNMVIDPGGSGFGTSHWQEEAFTFTSATPVLGNGFWVVPYTLTGVPIGKLVHVIPALQNNVLVAPPFTPSFSPDQQVTLTLSAPTAIGIDFEMTAAGGLH